MSIPVNLPTVEQAHIEFNSLVDKNAAKCEQLDSGELGAVGTQHLMLSLSNWQVFAHMSQLWAKTEPANTSTTSQAAILQALKSTFSI